MTETRFNFWTSYLKKASIFLALLGVYWAFSGVFDPFGLYEQQFSRHFWNKDLPPNPASTTFRFLMIPFGATITGYFVVQYLAIKNGFPKRDKWVWSMLVIGLLSWFFIDTMLCLYNKAYFNIVLANISTMVLMAPLFFLGKYFKTD